jgi:quercetin dioxygenase-like cupin family protein
MTQEITIALASADPETFTGPAFIHLLGSAEDEVSVKLYYVRFDPHGRTNWHAHAGTQILLITSGRCRYQREGEPAREAAAGESVRFEPGVRHWHGAAGAEPAVHVAINLEIRETLWFEPVSDTEYGS